MSLPTWSIRSKGDVMDRRQCLGEVDRVVIKIGSSSIMRNGSRVSRDFMDSVAEQVKRLKDLERRCSSFHQEPSLWV